MLHVCVYVTEHLLVDGSSQLHDCEYDVDVCQLSTHSDSLNSMDVSAIYILLQMTNFISLSFFVLFKLLIVMGNHHDRQQKITKPHKNWRKLEFYATVAPIRNVIHYYSPGVLTYSWTILWMRVLLTEIGCIEKFTFSQLLFIIGRTEDFSSHCGISLLTVVAKLL